MLRLGMIVSIPRLLAACRRAPPVVSAQAPAGSVVGPAPSPCAPAPAVVARPLGLVSTSPEAGKPAYPTSEFRLLFDRPLAPASTSRDAIRMEYVDAGVTFVVDPFRLMAVRLAADGQTILLDPPDLLAGRTVRLIMTDALRAADGAQLVPDPGLPRGQMRVLTWTVPALPPP